VVEYLLLKLNINEWAICLYGDITESVIGKEGMLCRTGMEGQVSCALAMSV
jgi:hypothetical protein